jgi:uracil-DNA glycosylase
MDKSWYLKLNEEFNKPYYNNLSDFVEEERSTKDIFPPKGNVFNAFKFEFNNLSVVLLGQDPYHTPGAANGLAFSVNKGVKIPPSLKNIFKEIKTEFPSYQIPENGDLNHWMEQGVLMLNTVLTVEKGKANSHKNKGWEVFTDNVIKMVSEEKENIVFLLWGRHAQAKKSLIDENKHLILESAHPSPFSARNGFFNNNHFVETNKYLINKGKKEIKW